MQVTPETLRIVLYYYLTFWILNTAAYAVVAYGLYRWKVFLRDTSAERFVATGFYITAIFGTARLIAGSVGFIFYETGTTGSLETIVILGMTSLFLNTSFISLEGYFLNDEAKTLFDLQPGQREVVRKAIQTFDELRRAADAR